jgi:excisionase family DNA binding protein
LVTDTADQLAAAIRQVIDDAVQAALRAQPQMPPRESVKEEPPPRRRLYPLAEAQQKLGISRTTMYQLLSDGQLPSVTIGRRRFVTSTALSTYVDGLE